RKRPCFPFKESERDFRGLLDSVFTAEALRVLSNKESTDSCNILFSFLRITSGAFISTNLFRRLLRIMTLLYRSFRSDVANRPPSNGTRGLSSGGITVLTFMIIHSGRFSLLSWDSRRDSTT